MGATAGDQGEPEVIEPAQKRVTTVADSPNGHAGARGAASRAGKQVSTALALLGLTASAIFGANAFGVRERFLGSETPDPRPAAASRAADATVDTAERPQSVLRSQPWWQDVTTLDGGTGVTKTAPFNIDAGAVQWRVKWSCDSGRFTMVESDRPKPLVETSCPGSGSAFSTRTGARTLDVSADGPWRLEIEQQVDVPLVEPPLPAFSAPGARAVARGSFYRIDQFGNGTVTIYRLADSTYGLRLDDFYVSPNVDLEIRFSVLDAPKTSGEYLGADASEKVAPLDVTTGAMNFVVPPGIDPFDYRSLVIWCPLIDSAYAAATLEPVQ